MQSIQLVTLDVDGFQVGGLPCEDSESGEMKRSQLYERNNSRE